MTRTLREKDPDRIGSDEPPRSKNASNSKDRKTGGGSNEPAAPSPWIRSLGSYDRSERREYQVTRFG
jgi:hypothetical protein